MSRSETLATAWHAIHAHSMRSLLTVLGILIGIAAVILTVGLGLGTQKDVSSQISSLGSNLLIVTPGSTTSSSGVRGGFGSATTLTEADATALGSKTAAPDVAAVAPEKSASEELVNGTTNWTTTVVGTTTNWMDVRSRTIETGRFLDAADETGQTTNIVLGSETATELFGTPLFAVGRTVTVDDIPFTVVGVLASAGSSSSTDLDDTAVVPLATAENQLVGGTDRTAVSTIYVKAASTGQISAADQETQSLLLNLHGITDSSDADFTVNSQDALVDTATSVYRTLTVLLTGIAALSLLVGGIGVMNIMLVSVTERTREIGLRKALGAPPGAIRGQFLTEASILGLGGGIVGAGLGILAAKVLPSMLDSSIVISLPAVFGSIAVALAIGLVFGVYPAVRAARLAPIDALRSE
jgi:putative ABC transport system permease protein